MAPELAGYTAVSICLCRLKLLLNLDEGLGEFSHFL